MKNESPEPYSKEFGEDKKEKTSIEDTFKLIQKYIKSPLEKLSPRDILELREGLIDNLDHIDIPANQNDGSDAQKTEGLIEEFIEENWRKILEEINRRNPGRKREQVNNFNFEDALDGLESIVLSQETNKVELSQALKIKNKEIELV